ncbi:hypothetical protein [Haliscomenobacter hydrossis]|uniref:Uncharacterized protein n=1 Tax=Haliscomenobacter hydrossis (strain ATCC 27775 / DSM 1100 / LMG 10767 / O) TaxID=760192 RepID=F4L052_HALH1|nr:hypothetical protein [Haliscomenobacter hydrossis]AEE52761.1 hypothetical protein Halhy_4933 [Haliscomenobacter hydrossis DSM 1100]
MASPSIKIPNDYTHHLDFDNGLNIIMTPVEVTTKVIGDKNQPVASLILGDPNQPITTTIQGNEAKPITTTIQGNKDKPIVSQVELLNLPNFSKQDLKDLLTPEIRVRIPNYNQVSFKLLGIEVFNICTSGESQVITEPYVPNAYERCEISCCEPDTRPFPRTPSSHPNDPTNPAHS